VEPISRRQFLPAAALGVASLTLPQIARAGNYPDQPISFIIPYGPGGTHDTYGREFASLLGRNLGHAVVAPINKPGAAGKEAIFQLLQAPPDGYNISLIEVPGILMARKSGPIDVGRLTWLANLGRDTYGLAVGHNSRIRNVADMKKLSAQRPIVFASTGVGSTDYLAVKVFAASLGLRVRLVSGYADSPNSVIAVTRGDVDAVVHSLTTLKQMQASGLSRTIFVFQEKSGMTGVEDASSVGKPDLGEIFAWRPVVAPPDLAQPLVARLSTALVDAAKSGPAKTWAAKIDTTLYPLDAAQTVKMVQQQKALVSKWSAVL
jgi:tripartite-type tricarboxylate transporter receptor subunit TctC